MNVAGQNKDMMERLSAAHARIAAEVEGVFGLVESMGGALSRLWSEAGSLSLSEQDLVASRPDIYACLDATDALLGAGYVFAEGVLDFTDRHIEWWQSASSGSYSQVSFDVNPKSPSGYDYYAKDWFKLAQSENARSVAGPLIDLQCSSSTVITFAVPVTLGQEHASVAAVDLSLGAFQAAIAGPLAAMEAPCVLVNDDRRVVASNDATWLDGDRLAERPTTGHGWVMVQAVGRDTRWLLAVASSSND